MNDAQVHASIHAVESIVASFRREMESVNEHINFFKRQIDELYKKPDVPAEFAAFKTVTENFVKDINDKNSTSKLLIDGIRSVIESLKNTTSVHTNELRQLRDSLPIMEKQITETKDVLSQKIVSISTAFTSRFDEHAEKQKKQLETFSNHALTAPKSVIESNQTIIEQLEVATLDSSNAILKTNNMELTLKLLERKLENLTIQVKKIELTQQA